MISPAPATWPECGQGCRLLLKGGEVVVKDFEVVNYQVPKNSYYRRHPDLAESSGCGCLSLP